ncbi:hypothetical protein [Stenotrophomonas phage BUCT608]|nr:hypothetical protein [Stenotrophomonas phage BUCT608]QYC97408.1 hypothetical protein [Stenotrophomonas phage BUCT608]
MGKYAPDPNYPSMIHFKPDDTANEFHYLADNPVNLREAIKAAVDHFMTFPEHRATINASYDRALIEARLEIKSEYIHTRCIYYDCFDPSDWDNYLVFTLETKE